MFSLFYICGFFCFSGGKEREGDLQYYPFRMTPYLMKVQDAELNEEQFCCLLLAERVHSGYEGNARHQHYIKITTDMVWGWWFLNLTK